MAKKHCERHYRFVANCPDCRAANSSAEDYGDTGDDRRLYQDVDYNEIEDENEIPVRPRAQIPKDDPYGGNRFHYSTPRSQNGKKIIMISIIIGVVIALIVGLYAYPLWMAKISLQNQLYTTKGNFSEGKSFWTVYSMNLWSTQFFFNKIGLIGGLIGAALFSFPPETTLIALIGTKTGWGRPSMKKALIINWTFGFLFFYLIGQGLDSGYFAYIMFSLEEGTLSYDFTNPLKAMSVLYDTHSVTMMDVFIYNNLIYPLISYIFGILIFRAVLNIINNAYLFQNKFKVTSNILYIIGLIFGVSYFSYPLNSLDGLAQIQSFSVLIGFIGFIMIGVIIEGVGKKNIKKNQFIFDSNAQKKSIITAGVIIGLILVPLFISIPTAISIDNDYSTWSAKKWGVQIDREVDWTRKAVGLNNFVELPIQNYTSSVITSDVNIIKSIRQYDRTAAGKKMGNQMGTTFETLADSDIIYIPSGIGKGEYWMAPKTVDINLIGTTAVRRHTEMYDHVEGFLALDTYSGELINDTQYMSLFGVGADYPIFFGEEHDPTYNLVDTSTTDLFAETYSLVAFEDDVLLYTDWGNDSESVTFTHRYDGIPDGNLTGMEAFWFTLNMGLTQDALKGGDKSYLINRNIKTRVGNALLPGMYMDPDPYLVLDSNNNKLYYAVSIISEINIGSFAQGSLYRFLGVCLIDVKFGDLHWIRNPNLNTVDDELRELFNLHLQFYNWESPEGDYAFMKDQMRYPETLWGNQLEFDYIYHVVKPSTFYEGSDFYAEPDDTVPYYIETDLGEGLEFVAVQIVEYVGEEATTLAGIYICRHGEHLGETLFFKVDKKLTAKPIGPGIAQQEYESQATQRLSLVTDKRYGNILLYPLDNSLYYFIPTYSAPSGTERLQLVGLVNAFDKTVAYGDTALEAYNNLNVTDDVNPPEGENITLNYKVPSEITYDINNWGLIETSIFWNEINDTLSPRNLTLQLNVYGVNALVKLFNQLINPVNGTSELWPAGVYNYTIANFSLNPGQGLTYPIRITMDPQGNSLIGFKYQITLLENNIPIIQSKEETLIVNNNASM